MFKTLSSSRLRLAYIPGAKTPLVMRVLIVTGNKDNDNNDNDNRNLAQTESHHQGGGWMSFAPALRLQTLQRARAVWQSRPLYIVISPSGMVKMCVKVNG